MRPRRAGCSTQERKSKGGRAEVIVLGVSQEGEVILDGKSPEREEHVSGVGEEPFAGFLTIPLGRGRGRQGPIIGKVEVEGTPDLCRGDQEIASRRIAEVEGPVMLPGGEERKQPEDQERDAVHGRDHRFPFAPIDFRDDRRSLYPES
jgi:hypothetical protein